MNTTPTTATAAATSPPAHWQNVATIPGYEIVERIGCGGYGEVWKARAPGGLTKAIKVIYGQLDEQRASRELKSLNYMKEVRHPFLLSLERIEVVEGHLVIVCELADASMKDRFEQCRASGLPGIPRDELLNYLRDAADALDYLCDHHSLQHLDVKPENLLLLSGRVKVADFGLVKDLHEATNMSMMGGLTPCYAPPEVFDGHPNVRSDQYSLAIVYQHMLTGSLPFSGRSPAQLAAQHLYSKPLLVMLSPGDQQVIGRALSKDPDARFPNCRAMVDALIETNRMSRSSGHTPVGTNAPRRPNGSGGSAMHTVSLGDAAFDPGAIAGRADTAAGEIHELPPIELAGDTHWCRPTLFLGIGGLAGKTLRRLRRRLRDRFHNHATIPAMPMLLVDTSVRAINEAMQGDEGTALHDGETLAVPLRSASDYRQDAPQYLRWLNRRWLYNVPRSQQTEGFRPLGRLAFVDHAEKIMERIKVALNVATDPETITASVEATGLPLADSSPQVFIVASISGGTGSGMVLDMAYAARKVLVESGFSGEDVRLLLTHSTDRKANTRDLAIGNAFACLRELHNFQQRGGHYPGDESCGLLPLVGAEALFPNTYFVHLGDDLNDEQFTAAADSLAEYLYRNTVTPAGEFFDKARGEVPPVTESNAETVVRTFGLSQIGSSKGDLPGQAAAFLCRTFIDQWRGSLESAPAGAGGGYGEPALLVRPALKATATLESDIRSQATKHCEQLQLSVERLVETADQILQAQMGTDMESYLIIQLKNQPAEELLPELPLEPLAQALAAGLHQVAQRQIVAVRGWVLDLLENSPARLRGAQCGVEWFVEHLRIIRQRLTEMVELLHQDQQRLVDQLLNRSAREAARHAATEANRGRVPLCDPQALQHEAMRLHEVVLRGVLRMAGEIHTEVATLFNQIINLRRDLSMLADNFPQQTAWAGEELAPAASGAASDPWSGIVEMLSGKMPELMQGLEQEIGPKFFADQGGLRRSLKLVVDSQGTFVKALQAAGRAVILRSLKGANLAGAVLDTGESGEQGTLRQCLDAANPRLASCGGNRRLLVVLPESSDEERWREEIRRGSAVEPTVAHDQDSDALLCYEMGDVPLRRAAASLLQGRREAADVAARLATRSDVSWS